MPNRHPFFRRTASALLAFALIASLLPGLAAAREYPDPIRLHPKNPHYFQWRGRPVALISSAEHYGAVLNLDFDFRKYLDTLAAAGMNYTRIFSGAYVEPDGAFNIARNTLAPRAGAIHLPLAPKRVSRIRQRREPIRPLAVGRGLLRSVAGFRRSCLGPRRRRRDDSVLSDVQGQAVAAQSNECCEQRERAWVTSREPKSTR